MKSLGKKLRKHQLDALRWSDGVMHPGFFMDMRTGKCLLTIRRIKRWDCRGPHLIVCPESATQGWLDELYGEGFKKVIELKGPAEKRHEDLVCNLSFSGIETYWFITNKECHRSLPEIKDISWDVMVFDESRFLANPKSGMSKFYVPNFRSANHRIILTGTPDYKQKLDYYQQLEFLGHRNLPYKNFWDFRASAFFQSGYDFILKKKHDDILKKALHKNCFFIRRKDIKGGRTQEYVKYSLKMPRKLRKKYSIVEEEFVLDTDKIIKSIFATQAHIWMMRMCGGFVDKEMVWDGKKKIIIDLMENELRGENIVIFCRFKAEVFYLCGLLNGGSRGKIKSDTLTGDTPYDLRRKIIKDFNCKKINTIIAHPNAISHGTDLSSATTIIFYSQPNGKEIRDQSEKRIMTYADEKHMLIIDLLVKDTVDEDTRVGHLENDSSIKLFERAVKRYDKKAS